MRILISMGSWRGCGPSGSGLKHVSSPLLLTGPLLPIDLCVAAALDKVKEGVTLPTEAPRNDTPVIISSVVDVSVGHVLAINAICASDEPGSASESIGGPSLPLFCLPMDISCTSHGGVPLKPRARGCMRGRGSFRLIKKEECGIRLRWVLLEGLVRVRTCLKKGSVVRHIDSWIYICIW